MKFKPLCLLVLAHVLSKTKYYKSNHYWAEIFTAEEVIDLDLGSVEWLGYR